MKMEELAKYYAQAYDLLLKQFPAKKIRREDIEWARDVQKCLSKTHTETKGE